MRPTILILFVLMLLGACKKDNSNLYTLSFTVGDTIQGYNKVDTALLTIRDTFSEQFKGLEMTATTNNNVFNMTIVQNISGGSSNAISTGIYNDVDVQSACLGPAFYPFGCTGFWMQIVTNGNYLESFYEDTTGEVDITSLSFSPNRVSGTFHCLLNDSYGHITPITNGRFTNVPFALVQ